MRKWMCVILSFLFFLTGCQRLGESDVTSPNAPIPTESVLAQADTPPARTEPESTAATLSQSGLQEGYYIFAGSTVDGEFIPPGDVIHHIRVDPYYTGYLYTDGIISTISWSNTCVIDSGSNYRYTIEDGMLLVDYITAVNHYTYFGDTLPESHTFPVPPAGEYIVFAMESNYYENRDHLLPDPLNGMLRLNEDGTCTFFLDGEAKKGTWDVAIQIQSSSLPYMYVDSSMATDGFPFLVVVYGARNFALAPVTHDPESNTYIWDFLLE